MQYSFTNYLLSKQSVDDRALNQHVFTELKKILPVSPFTIIEVGAGIGTMLVRLLRWRVDIQGEYILVDEMPENITYAASWVPAWAQEQNYIVTKINDTSFRLTKDTQDILVHLVCCDVFDFINSRPEPADLLIAHAFLDLLPMPESLQKIFSIIKQGGHAWLTINFDGVTTLEPSIDPDFDREVEKMYHHSMDTRLTGGDSQAGRHLFSHIKASEAELIAAGASDWVIYPVDNHYLYDEAYFLHFILHFFELSLAEYPGIDKERFQQWLLGRRTQIDRAELVYIAHQSDFLIKVNRSETKVI